MNQYEKTFPLSWQDVDILTYSFGLLTVHTFSFSQEVHVQLAASKNGSFIWQLNLLCIDFRVFFKPVLLPHGPRSCSCVERECVSIFLMWYILALLQDCLLLFTQIFQTACLWLYTQLLYKTWLCIRFVENSKAYKALSLFLPSSLSPSYTHFLKCCTILCLPPTTANISQAQSNTFSNTPIPLFHF